MSECLDKFSRTKNIDNKYLDQLEKIPFKNSIEISHIINHELIPEWKERRGYIELIQSKKIKKGKECILYIHGGSFIHDSPVTYRTVTFKLAHETKLPVFAPDYTQAPIKQFPTQINEIINIAQFLKQFYKKIYLLGDSAGGTIALSCLLVSNIFTAGILYSPWINLHSNSSSYYSRAWCAALKTGDPIFTEKPEKEIRESIDTALLYLGPKKNLNNPIANPIMATPKMLKSLPPLLFFIGDAEVLRNDTLVFASNAQKVNNNIFVRLYDNMWHDWLMYSQGCGTHTKIAKALEVYSISNYFLHGKFEKKQYKFNEKSNIESVNIKFVL